MNVIKGLLFFFLVLVPGVALFAVAVGWGAWGALSACGRAATWALRAMGVHDTNVVIGTLVVSFFVVVIAAALRRDVQNW